jgi:hypothetical protein
MEDETYQERTERYKKEAERLKEVEGQYKVTGHADSTFVKNGRIYLLESQTLGIGITDIEVRRGFTLHGVTISLPEPDTLVLTYERGGESICLVGSGEILANLQEQAEASKS